MNAKQELKEKIPELEKELKMSKEKIMYKERIIKDFDINTLSKQNSNYTNKENG